MDKKLYKYILVQDAWSTHRAQNTRIIQQDKYTKHTVKTVKDYLHGKNRPAKATGMACAISGD